MNPDLFYIVVIYYLALCRKGLLTLYWTVPFLLLQPNFSSPLPLWDDYSGMCLHVPKNHSRITFSCFFRFLLIYWSSLGNLRMALFSSLPHSLPSHCCFSLILVKLMISIHIIVAMKYICSYETPKCSKLWLTFPAQLSFSLELIIIFYFHVLRFPLMYC